MKQLFVAAILSILISVITMYVCLNFNKNQAHQQTPIQPQALTKFVSNKMNKDKKERPSVVFILGEDKDADNQYYGHATAYYQQNKAYDNYWINTSCRSLLEVRNFLAQHADGLAWGNIHLVVHSNEWKGLGVSVFPEGKRANSQSLKTAINEQAFLPLPDSILDRQTEMIFYGCGLGKNKKLMNALSVAFGGVDDQKPVLRSSKLFIQYGKNETGMMERYLTEFWYGYFPTGNRPHASTLAKQFQQNHPEVVLDFEEALERKQPRFPGDSYHYYFNIPVTWTVTYPTKEERPNLKTKADKEAFLNAQTELMRMVEATKIPKDHFRWQFQKVIYTFEDGTKEPAIQIRGKSSVVCVLRSLIKEDQITETTMPFRPSLNDSVYFTSIYPDRINSKLSR